MSSPTTSDLILVERSNVPYKCTQFDYQGSGAGGIAFVALYYQTSIDGNAYWGEGYYGAGRAYYLNTTNNSTSYNVNTSASSYASDRRPVVQLCTEYGWTDFIPSISDHFGQYDNADIWNSQVNANLVSWTVTADEIKDAVGGRRNATIGGVRFFREGGILLQADSGLIINNFKIGIKKVTGDDNDKYTNNSGSGFTEVCDKGDSRRDAYAYGPDSWQDFYFEADSSVYHWTGDA